MKSSLSCLFISQILSEQKEMKQNCGMTSQKVASIKIEVQTEIESNKKLQSDINNMFFEKQRLLVSVRVRIVLN